MVHQILKLYLNVDWCCCDRSLLLLSLLLLVKKNPAGHRWLRLLSPPPVPRAPSTKTVATPFASSVRLSGSAAPSPDLETLAYDSPDLENMRYDKEADQWLKEESEEAAASPRRLEGREEGHHTLRIEEDLVCL